MLGEDVDVRAGEAADVRAGEAADVRAGEASAAPTAGSSAEASTPRVAPVVSVNRLLALAQPVVASATAVTRTSGVSSLCIDDPSLQRGVDRAT